jgi:hypothetical protein
VKKKSRKFLWVIIGVVVVIVFVVIPSLAYTRPIPGPVNVLDEHWTVWDGGAFGFLNLQFPPPHISGLAGGLCVCPVTFTSSAPVLLYLTMIILSPPFSLHSVSPSLPVAVPPGASWTVTLTIILPSSPGNYALTGIVTTY